MNQLARFNRGLLGELLSEHPAFGYLVRPLHGDALPESFKIDVKETSEAFLVEAELPGVKKEDIHVNIEGKQVSISAEVKQFDEQRQDTQVIRSERYYGAVSRAFQLAHEIDDINAQASYEHGVLQLILPKRAKTTGKKLTIN